MKRQITLGAWDAIKLGQGLTLYPRGEVFAPRKDHDGGDISDMSYMHGYVLWKRDDYMVLQDIHSYVVRRDEISEVEVTR